jgi:hypothetical protein
LAWFLLLVASMKHGTRSSAVHCSKLGFPVIGLASLLAGPLAGCAHPPKAYVFTVPPQQAGQSLELLARHLEAEGHHVANIDRNARQIASLWEDTHYRFRETADQEHETNIFVRYRLSVAGATPADQVVTLTADVQRCAADSAYVTPLGVSGPCVQMKRMTPTHQRALDGLGQRLSAALSAPVTTMPAGG